ncbi:cAMP-dependent protein kinase type II regulatory subunit-like [Cimex lectularius]|uniref:Cyclic nucleotide-binding domain-containing protein n=1 Tax=Cimex lectularius TaxID=79782 RepID=A0A8I6R9W0_CIMLE|nr:cAMP-dependent protein kinase type II regulatory subunit-like [Cimex lectularius]
MSVRESGARSANSADSVSMHKNAPRRKAVAGETYNPEHDTHADIVKHPKSDAQRAVLEGHLKNIVFMQNLDKDQMHQILDAFFLKNVKAGDYIIKQGDEGDYFYIVEKGKYEAFVTNSSGNANTIRTYDGYGSFGELALLYSMPRAASVKADTDGIVWALDRKTFTRILVKAAHKNRKLYEECLKNVKILSHLTELERLNLADALLPRMFSDGQVIMKENEQADGMYFVLSGQVFIHKTVNGKQVPLKIVERGGYFGELALLTKGTRAATAVAKGNVTTAFLETDAFERLLGSCEEAMKNNVKKYGIKLEHAV